jgi:hypothetical protein
MIRLYFKFPSRPHTSFSVNKKSHAEYIEEMEEWLKENGITPATEDTMIWNQLNDNPKRLYRLRESKARYEQYVISFSHPTDIIHFKLRWSDEWDHDE